MKKSIYYFLLILGIIFFPAQNTFSQKFNLQKEKKFELGIHYQSYSASSYYNLNDSLNSSAIDTIKLYNENGGFIGDTVIRYTFDFKRTTIGLEFKYNFDKNLLLYTYLPLSFYSLNEKTFRDAYGVRYNRLNLSKTRLDYLEFGTNYKITQDNIISGLIAKVRIPTSFQKGQYHNPLIDSLDFNFLSDGAFEFLAGTSFGFKAQKFSFENEVLYNYRAEDFKDQLIINSALGFTTVPNTKLTLFGIFKVSLASFDNARPLIPNEEVIQENNFAAGAEFMIMPFEDIIGKINYHVTLFGKNTWNYGVFNIYVGYQF